MNVAQLETAFRFLLSLLEDTDARLVVGLGIVTCLLAYSFLWPARRPKPLLPDGMHILWGHEKEVYMKKPGVVYKRWINELGRAYRIKAALLMPDIIVLADPVGLSHILQKHIYDYHHSGIVRPRVERLMGRGLAWVEGEDDHKRMRRMISPSFSPDNLRHMGQLRIMEAASRVLNDMTSAVQEMKAGENVVNILEWTSKAALNVIGRVAFHHDFDGGNDEHAKKILSGRSTASTQVTKFVGFATLMLLRRFTFLNGLPIKTIQIQGNAREAIQSGVVHQLVQYEQSDMSGNEKRSRKDLLNRLLVSFSKNDLSKDELFAHISTIVVGGQETTSLALAFAVSELSKHPEAQARLQKEVLDFNGEPTYDEFMTRFPYMDAVLKEIVRLYPGVPYMERVATKDDVIPLHYPTRMSDGKEYNHLEIRMGQPIIIPIISIHRLDALWGADAETFNPDRWLRPLPRDVELYMGWSHLLGFSDGPRSCVGIRLAIIEFKVVMFSLFHRFKFEPVDEIIDLKISSSLQPFVRGKEADGPQLPVKVVLL